MIDFSSLLTQYNTWWKTELANNPAHILVETILLVLVFYIIFFTRSYKPGQPEVKLSRAEEDALIAAWEPEPLVPESFDPQNGATAFSSRNVIEREHGDGVHVDVTRYKGTDEEGIYKEGLVEFASFDFLGLAQHKSMKNTIAETLNKYGCGSCGPRGFYGTIDVHLTLEADLARFMGTERGIIFSDNQSTISSVIPAFAKRGNLIFMDEGCSAAVCTGVKLSRSRVITFKHNDMKDLERKLKAVERDDKRRGNKGPAAQRRFLVVEGLYRDFGDLCPLRQLVRLKKRHGLRLVVDESLSIGVLGATGRGITEHFGLHVNDVDLLTGSLEAVLGSVGGFLVGTQLIVDHLVLSAAGYVFSASAPAYTATAASEALRLLDETHEGPERLKKLETNTKRARKELARVVKPAGKKPAYFDVLGDESSPLILLQLGKEYSVYRKTLKAASDAVDDGVEDGFQKLALKSKRENELEDSRREDLRVLRAIADELFDHGVLVGISDFEGANTLGKRPVPFIRIAIRSGHTVKQITSMAAAVKKAAAKCVKKV